MAWYGNFQKLLIMHLRFYIQSFFRTNSEHFSVSRKIKKNSLTISPKKVNIFFPQNTFLKNNLSKLPNCCLFEFVSNSFAIGFFFTVFCRTIKNYENLVHFKGREHCMFFMIVFIKKNFFFKSFYCVLLYYSYSITV